MRCLSEYIFTQYTGAALSNSTVETSLLNSLNGTAALPANTWAVGTALSWHGFGRLGTNGGGTLQVTCSTNAGAGAVPICDLGTITPASFAPTRCFWLELLLVCGVTGGTGYGGAIGRLNASGIMVIDGVTYHFKNGLQVPIDTTVIQTLDLTAQWSTANTNNQITLDGCMAVITGS